MKLDPHGGTEGDVFEVGKLIQNLILRGPAENKAIMDKGRISKFNKKFQNFKTHRKIKCQSSINADGDGCMAC